MRQDIFATPFWHLEGAPQELVDELYQGAYQFKKRYKNNILSNQGGYQSPPFSLEDFHPQGRQYINEVTEAIAEIGKCEIRWWYNINPTGAWNLPHTHPNSDYALVFYVTDSDGLLRFMNPQQMRLEVHDAYRSLDAKKGDILIFPSDLVHYVMPNPREEDRISISMNLQLC